MTTDNDPRESLIRMLLDQGAPSTPSRQDLGWLGAVFGGHFASSNIAGLVIVVALLLLIAVAWAGDYETAGEVVTGALSLITLALGYLFGAHKGR